MTHFIHKCPAQFSYLDGLLRATAMAEESIEEAVQEGGGDTEPANKHIHGKTDVGSYKQLTKIKHAWKGEKNSPCASRSL